MVGSRLEKFLARVGVPKFIENMKSKYIFDDHRTAFWMAWSMKNGAVKNIVDTHLQNSSSVCVKRFSKDYTRFCRILLYYYASPGLISQEEINIYIGHKCNASINMLYKSGWLCASGLKKTFILSKKSDIFIKELLKVIEREFSVFYVKFKK